MTGPTSGGGAGGSAQVDVAYVDVTVRHNGEQTMRDLENEVDRGGQRAGETGGNAFTRGMQGGLAGLKTIALAGVAAVGAAVVGIGAFIADGFAGVTEGQDAVSQLETTIKSMGNVAGVSSEQLQEFAGKIQETTKFSAETVNGVQSMLLTFGEVKAKGGIFDRATQSALDMAQALGSDASGAAVQLGKALNDPIQGVSALSKVGVSFSDDQKKVIESLVKTGDMAGAQTIILKELEKQFGGSAAAAGQTFSGQMTRAQNALGEVAESIAIRILPLVQRLADAFIQNMPQIQAFTDRAVNAVIAGFEYLSKNVFPVLVTAFNAVRPVVLATAQVLGELGSRAVPVIVTAFNAARPVLAQVATTLVALGTQAVPVLMNAIRSGQTGLLALVTGFQQLSVWVQRNKEILIPLAAGLGTVAAAFAIHRAAVVAATAITTAWTAVTTAATAASVALRVAIAFITGPVGLAIAAITALIAVGVYLYRNWDEVKARALQIWAQVKETISRAMQGVVTYLQNLDLKEVAVRLLVGFVNGMRGAVGLVLRAGEAVGGAILTALKALPAKMLELAGQIVAGLVNGIKAGVGRVGEAARNLASSAFDAVKKKLNIQSPSKEMFILGEHTANGFANGIEKTAPAVQKAAAKVADTAVSELAKARAALEKGISMDKWVDGLSAATRAQLEHAQAVARSAGDAEKYNAIKSELARRQDVATAATQKATDAAKQQREELSNNRAQIAAGEAQERYVLGLRSATSAQLASALQTAKSAGEVERYNLIKTEQQRREDASTAASDRATSAAKAAAEQLTANRKAITDGLAFGVYVEGLTDYTDAQLAAARANALSAGDAQKFNAVLAEQKSRADAAAQSVSDFAAAQIAAANARFADTQGATDSAYRQTFGADDAGLIKALAATTGLSVDRIRRDVQGALNDAKTYAPQAAAVIERVWADALVQRQKAAQAEQDSYAATVQFALDTIGKVSDTSLMQLYTQAQATRDSTLMAAVLKEGERRALDFEAQLEAGIQASDKALSDLASLKPSGQDLAAQVGITPDTLGTFTDLLDRMGELRGDLAEPGVAEAWAQSIEDLGKRGELTTSQVAALKDQLKDLQTLTSGPLLPDNLAGRGIADGTTVGADDPATGALTGAERDILLKVAIESDPDELQAALDGMELAGKGATDLAGVYREALEQINASNVEVLASITAGVDDAGNVIYQTEDQLRGIGVASEDAAPAVFDLANAIANLSQFDSIDALQALIDTAGLAEEDAQALREAWQSQNTALLDLVTGYDEAGNAIYATDEQLRGIGVSTGETSEAFFDMGNAVKNVGEFTRAELESIITTAQLTADQAQVLRDAWKDVQLNATLNLNGFDTGVKQLDILKVAFDGVSKFVTQTFEDLASGADISAGSVVKSFAIMALGVIKQIATMIAAQAALIAVTALIDSATLNPRAFLTIAAAAAVAGIAGGLAARLGADAKAATPSTNTTSRPTTSTPSTPSSNSNISIPSSQISVIAAPEWVMQMGAHVDKFGRYVDRLTGEGINVRTDIPQGGNGGSAPASAGWQLGLL